MMAALETITLEVKHGDISDFYQNNLSKEKTQTFLTIGYSRLVIYTAMVRVETGEGVEPCKGQDFLQKNSLKSCQRGYKKLEWNIRFHYRNQLQCQRNDIPREMLKEEMRSCH